MSNANLFVKFMGMWISNIVNLVLSLNWLPSQFIILFGIDRYTVLVRCCSGFWVRFEVLVWFA